MNILLINDNPVVNKLVTLSAQKTSDNLEVVDSLENLESSTYDLVVIDDTLYSDELHMELNAKVQYSSSLYICARDAEEVSDFTKILKKPFLPTDLVELFSVLSKVVDEIDLSVLDEHENEVSLELQELEELEDEIEELEGLEELEDEIEELESLDEELDLGELEDDLEEEMTGDRILDDEEAQKVKDLLEETDMNIDDELLLEAEEEIDIDIASQIENSVEDLSEEDLESEIDEGTLLNIVSGDLDSLTSRDMKIAVGEDVDSVEAEVLEEDTASIEEEIEEDVRVEETVIEENKGVEALKNLLAALSDKNVAASMKGMKISINITLGDD
ncbi:MAG: hypothetical protein SPLUMA1_SPLUMAMAG1_00234 [uncultured Sulfurimonas sp.]|nr:MAG: hypothetical protein SPLUMA1_SPLUMAMAG1_00234 [uncultured Sulfurimonas sp.]